MNIKRYIWICLLPLLICSCRQEEPQQKVTMPISISLPANEVYAANRAPIRRAVGDPGTTERFLFPHHLYIIVIKKTGASTWTLWQSIHRTLTDDDWEAKSYVGLLPTMGDSIYQYTEQINLLLASGDKFEGRVYAIASAEALTFNQELNTIDELDDVLNLTFDVSAGTIKENLGHIYSSPYNLEQNGAYFGSFNSTYQKVPHVHLLLYHVAAKVDITWNVPTEKRIKANPSEAVRLTYMEVQNLFAGNAYCFKPMRNELATKVTSGYNIANIVRPTDEGMWWEGRKYFYTIPYIATDATKGGKVYFPLQMLLKTNGSAGTGYQPTLNMQVDTTAVFVPWMRATFNLTQPLTDESETKTVDI